MPDDVYITTNSIENTPINIIVSGDVDKSVYISTIYEPVAPVRSVNGKLGFVILDKNDIGLSNVENISITDVSGFLQYQIDNLDSGYASQTELNTLSGNLISTGSNLSNLIYSLSGFVTGQDVYLGSIINNTGIYLYNTIDSLSGSLNSTGQYLAYKINDISLWTGLSTGLFYPLNENPANYLTGVDLSNYVLKNETGVFATKSELVATGIDLQNQIDNINDAGFITGVDLSNYYTNDNPSGYLVQSDLSPYLTGFNSGDYVLKSDTGVFATSESLNQSGSYLQALTNSASGNLQSQLNNLDLNYASQAEFDSLSGKLNNSGSNLQNQINNLYSSGFITGVDLSNYVTDSETGVFATKSELNASGQYLRDLTTGTSGNLQNQITNLNNNTGNYYPNTNPSGYINSDIAQSIFVNVTGDNLSGPLGVTTVIFSGGGYLQFESGNPAWQEGRVFYDADSHSLSYYNDASDVTVNVGQEQIVRVSNGWTGTIANGSVVYISGAQGSRPSVYPASASNSFFHTHDILGVATHDIITQGYVTINGIVNGLNTNSYSPGDTLYLSNTSGQFTNIYPAAPTPAIKIGIVTRQHVNQGSIFVKIDNGHDLSQSHDVYLTNLSNGDILRYNSASGVWTNSLLDTGIFATISSLIATGEYLSNNISIISGNLESTGLFLSQQIDSLSGNLNATGIDLYNQIEQSKILSIAYAIAL